jgi:hypothetical protein
MQRFRAAGFRSSAAQFNGVRETTRLIAEGMGLAEFRARGPVAACFGPVRRLGRLRAFKKKCGIGGFIFHWGDRLRGMTETIFPLSGEHKPGDRPGHGVLTYRSIRIPAAVFAPLASLE